MERAKPETRPKTSLAKKSDSAEKKPKAPPPRYLLKKPQAPLPSDQKSPGPTDLKNTKPTRLTAAPKPKISKLATKQGRGLT